MISIKNSVCFFILPKELGLTCRAHLKMLYAFKYDFNQKNPNPNVWRHIILSHSTQMNLLIKRESSGIIRCSIHRSNISVWKQLYLERYSIFFFWLWLLCIAAAHSSEGNTALCKLLEYRNFPHMVFTVFTGWNVAVALKSFTHLILHIRLCFMETCFFCLSMILIL